MISKSILAELKTAWVALFSGALITVVYDVLRIFRRIISHGNLWIGIEDFFFWIWTTFWIFSVLYRENDGNLRIYTILFMVLGMFLYHRIIGEPLVNITGKVLKKLKAGFIMRLRRRKKDGNKNQKKKKA